MSRLHTRREERIDTGAAVLWGVALLLGALIIVQAGRFGRGSQAMAEVSEVGDLVVLTAAAAADEDVLCVLDTRAERVLVYSVKNRNTVELEQSLALPELFQGARAGGARR